MKTPDAPGWLAVCLLVMTAAAELMVGAEATGTVPYRPGYIVGADISSVPAAEARGMKFSDNGAQKDILQILKDHGFNYIRLRLFVEPKNPGGYSPQGWCDLPHTLPMAKRVKQAGMGLLLDFHYSDTWADPGKQTKPLAWRQLPPDQLAQTMRDYTRDAIDQLKAAGGEPDMVQIGNEITPGLLLNTLLGGRGGGAQTVSTQPEGSARDWNMLASLLKAGVSGVKDVDPRILIVLHIDKGGDNAASRRGWTPRWRTASPSTSWANPVTPGFRALRPGGRRTLTTWPRAIPISHSSSRRSGMRPPSQIQSCAICPATAVWERSFGNPRSAATTTTLRQHRCRDPGKNGALRQAVQRRLRSFIRRTGNN